MAVWEPAQAPSSKPSPWGTKAALGSGRHDPTPIPTMCEQEGARVSGSTSLSAGEPRRACSQGWGGPAQGHAVGSPRRGLFSRCCRLPSLPRSPGAPGKPSTPRAGLLKESLGRGTNVLPPGAHLHVLGTIPPLGSVSFAYATSGKKAENKAGH